MKDVKKKYEDFHVHVFQCDSLMSETDTWFK